jgi:hypothetical protein
MADNVLILGGQKTVATDEVTDGTLGVVHSDGSGGTTGTIGNKPISTYGDVIHPGYHRQRSS